MSIWYHVQWRELYNIGNCAKSVVYSIYQRYSWKTAVFGLLCHVISINSVYNVWKISPKQTQPTFCETFFAMTITSTAHVRTLQNSVYNIFITDREVIGFFVRCRLLTFFFSLKWIFITLFHHGNNFKGLLYNINSYR